MKKQKNLFRALSLLMALVMFLSLTAGAVIAKAENLDPDPNPDTDPDAGTPPVSHNSTIDVEQTGSISVTKYVSSDTIQSGENAGKPSNTGTATGTENDAIDSSFSTLKDVKFLLVKVADASAVMSYYDGKSTAAAPDVANLTVPEGFDGTKDDALVSYGSTSINKGITSEKLGWVVLNTNGDGFLKFENLPVGFYILKEITWPVHISGQSETTVISLPMVNTKTSSNPDNSNPTADSNNRDWMYDIHVFPKNVNKKSSVTVNKVDTDGAPLSNVTFQLWKAEIQEDGGLSDWAVVNDFSSENYDEDAELFLTDAAGHLTISDLVATKYGTRYKLVEVYTAGTSPEGYIVDMDPIYFTIDKDRIIHWDVPGATAQVTTDHGERFANTKATVTDNTNLSFKLRNEKPTLVKLVQDNPHSGSTAFHKTAEYEIDEVITYQLTIYVPRNAAQMPAENFIIKDVPDVGITDSSTKSDFTVTYAVEVEGEDGKKTTETKSVTAFTVAAVDAVAPVAATEEEEEVIGNGAGFTMTFDSTAVLSEIAGKTITVTYKAKLNKDAVIAGDGNDNDVTLTYDLIVGKDDNVQAASIPTNTLEDYARVFTYLLKVIKRLDSETGSTASGVVFQLLKTKTGTPVNVVAVDDENGVYRIAAADDASTSLITDMTTAADGTITIQGVENTNTTDCKYFLKEIKTVTGYNLLSEPFEVDIAIGVPETSITEKAATDENTIINKAGFVLPQTGSMGYLLFCAAGLLLIGGGAAIIFGDRKKVIR